MSQAGAIGGAALSVDRGDGVLTAAAAVGVLTLCLDVDLADAPACREAVSTNQRRLRAVREQQAALADVENRLQEAIRRLRGAAAG